MSTRFTAKVLALVACSLGMAATAAEPYPDRPVKIVVPFAAGGSLDALARNLGQELGARLGQPVVIENKPGAGGMLGSMAVKNAAPDGYTLLFGSIGSHAINPAIKKDLPYDALQDFQPIGHVNDGALVLLVSPRLGVASVQELVALTRRDKSLSYASVGVGSISHFAGELFKASSGARLLHVPYSGNAALLGLIAGETSMMIETLPNALGSIEGGKLKALAVTSSRRVAALPDVPTFAETGMRGMEINAWTGLFSPARSPAPIVQRLAGEIRGIAHSPDYAARIARIGYEVAPESSPQAFRSLVQSEITRWRAAARTAGIQPD